MSENNKKQAETFALRPVAPEEQKSWVEMVFVQAGMIICIPGFLMGAMLAESMTTVNALIAGIGGWGLVVFLTFVLGVEGADLHVPSCVLCQATFGSTGSRIIISSVFAISCVGFFGLQTNVCGLAFVNLMRESFGITIPVMASSIFWGLVMVIIAVWGMDALKKLDTASVPLLLAIMLLGTILAFRHFGTAGFTTNEVTEPTMGMAEGIGLSFSFMAVGAITAPDLTRYQRDRRDTVKSSFWGIMPAGVITMAIGVIMTRIAGIYDISMVMVTVGIPILGVVVMIIATLTTNSINAYCGGLDIIMLFGVSDHRRREATFISGMVGVLLAVVGILDFIEVFLNWISFVFAPIGGVMIADYWFIGRGKPENWHPMEGFNWVGIAATVISLVIALFIPIGVFNVNGIVVAMIVYLILERFFPSKSRPELAAHTESEPVSQ